MTPDPIPHSERQEPTLSHRIVFATIQGIFVLAVLGVGGYGAYRLVKSGPKAERKPPARTAQVVEVETVHATTERVVVQAMGAVEAAREMDLQARVSGEVMDLSPECSPGGRFVEGAVIAKIDDADYTLAVEQQAAEILRLAATVEQRKSEAAERQSAIEVSQTAIDQSQSQIIQSDAALEIERGQQAVSKQEYALLGKTVKGEDRALILREPQLRSAEATCQAARAALRSAQAKKTSAEAMAEAAQAMAKAAEASKAAADVALRKAKLDLTRTTIKSPFNAIVESRSIERGSQVTPTTRLARLIGTDEYWVEASVPVDRLKWIRIPRKKGESGSPVRIYDDAAWGPKAHRTGTVFRLTSGLETEGRMARLLIRVSDPLALAEENAGKPALLLGSYVRVEIDGLEVENVIPIKRDYVHDGDRVWVMTPGNTLDIRRVTIRYGGRERVLV
ncbi:HlyD family efflux transporter periplasmic adaptor subunit, partial [bacterium]|nr:HlyD family efflux transporter periplasmic adaptor subunit [bacterium]